MKTQPKIASIVIPTYNSSGFIKNTLNSIEVINNNDYEVIIVDDRSDDIEILEKILSKYKNVLLVKKTSKTNAADSRNIGYSKAKGKFVFFLDSDDYYKENHIQRRIDLHIATGMDIIFGNYLKDMNGIKSNLLVWNGQDFRDYLLLKKGDVRSSTISIFKQWNENFIPFDAQSYKHQDWIFAIKNQDRKKFYFDKMYSVQINDRSGNMSSKQNIKASDYFIREYLATTKQINGFCYLHLPISIRNNDISAFIFFVQKIKVDTLVNEIRKNLFIFFLKSIPNKKYRFKLARLTLKIRKIINS